MRITLSKLRIKNFKGIRSFEIVFDLITTIYGANASGKTSLFDAFLWLFFGKNSEDKSSFDVKPLDKNNNFIERIEVEVEAIILADGQEISVKKVLRQKWTKPKGSPIEKYAGDENIYYWNDVPKKESEFKDKIKSLLGDESLFRLITNPFYFNNLKWQERRQILMDIAGEVSHYEILDKVMNVGNKHLYNDIITALNQKKTLAEYQAELSAKKRKINDELKLIPSRIDEVKHGRPADRDFKKVREDIEKLQAELAEVTAAMNDEAAKLAENNKTRLALQKEYNDQVQAKQRRIYELKNKIQNIEFDVRLKAKESSGNIDAELRAAQTKLAELKLDETKYKNSVASLHEQLKAKNEHVEALYNLCDAIEAETFEFDETNCKCPTCKQSLPEDSVASKKETLLASFNKDKRTRLDDAIAKGKAIKDEIAHLETRIENGQKTITETADSITQLSVKIHQLQQTAANQQSPDDIKAKMLEDHTEYQAFLKELAETEALEIPAPEFSPVQTDNALKEKHSSISNEINRLQITLSIEEQIAKADKRIIELSDQESKLSQSLAELEGLEYCMLEFTKAKMEIIDQRINGKFKYVQFKMFERQTNGQEVPTCETLINSNGSPVPFASANNAARINAGIDIINALCDHYNVYAPVFVDNAESVTDIIESDSQMIRLIVMRGAKLSVNQPDYSLENVA